MTFVPETELNFECESSPESETWHRSLAEAVRDVETLFARLGLPESQREAAQVSARLFPLMVPESYLQRMEIGNPEDPLLLQVLPSHQETIEVSGFNLDAVDDSAARVVPGLLHKYAGRALLMATGSCAVHCRYCFRRHYPYKTEPRTQTDWQPALEYLQGDESIQEIILSGGDPLMLTDTRLEWLIGKLATIPHLKRLRIHSRLPIVLPNRVTPKLTDILTSHRLQPVMIVHANHPAEIVGDCAEALTLLVKSGIPTLNQAVLLKGINDDNDTQFVLCERLINLGVLPYYLHQLDRVSGTAHFEVPEATGKRIIAELRTKLPGYAVPQYVQELPGEPHKTPL